MELPSPDTTTAPPSIATSPDSARHLRHAFGIAPLGRDNLVNYSQPHPREAAQFTRAFYLSRDMGALTILAVLRQIGRLRHKLQSNDRVFSDQRIRTPRGRLCPFSSRRAVSQLLPLMPESNPENERLLAQRTNRAPCRFGHFDDWRSRLRMRFEFFHIRFRPFPTNGFAVLLCLSVCPKSS
jgi:hypothetical protein